MHISLSLRLRLMFWLRLRLRFWLRLRLRLGFWLRLRLRCWLKLKLRLRLRFSTFSQFDEICDFAILPLPWIVSDFLILPLFRLLSFFANYRFSAIFSENAKFRLDPQPPIHWYFSALLDWTKFYDFAHFFFPTGFLRISWFCLFFAFCAFFANRLNPQFSQNTENTGRLWLVRMWSIVVAWMTHKHTHSAILPTGIFEESPPYHPSIHSYYRQQHKLRICA